jgi:uncharacterized membrane protein YdfJ with MMPL/SSD domain
MARALYRLGHFCAAHPLYILIGWIVLAAGVSLAVRTVGSLTSNDLELPGSQSQEATDLLAANFPPQQNGSNPIVSTSPRATSPPGRTRTRWRPPTRRWPKRPTSTRPPIRSGSRPRR